VRERQVVSDATAFTFDLAKGADLLVVDATAHPGVSADVLEREVAREIDDLEANGVSDAEVERAVALIETGFISSIQSAGERADKLSMFATLLGDPALVNEQSERYQRVTTERVNAFARSHLGEDNRATLMYDRESRAGTEESGSDVAVAAQAEVGQ